MSSLDTPPSRQKSCRECVRGKRKCTQELPRCKRCAKKNIPCGYPNNRGTVADVPIPELDFQWLDDLMQNPEMLPWSGGLQPQISAVATGPMVTSSAPISTAVTSWSSSEAPQNNEPDYLAEAVRPIRTSLARAETEAAVQRFRSWPDKWLKEGKAPFIHAHLYSTTMPKPLQDAYAACAIYSTKTRENEHIAFTVIESQANELLRAPNHSSWTPLDLLSACQALLIFQLIRLFDGDIRQRALAEQAEPVLEAWTEQLKSRTESEQRFTTITAPSWRSWIFAESVRRTVTMSVFLSGIYSLVKLGFCTVGENVSANCFTAQRELWETASPAEFDRARQTCKPYWVQRMDFGEIMLEGSGVELDDFGMVMMITYKGQDTVDKWLAQAEVDRALILDSDLHHSLLGMVGDVTSVSSSSDHFESGRNQHSGSVVATN
ncbi:hypothetical protein EJ04DRAFT_508518 [Polyplosphaeria fusca]|uniref:Zn(2)-C6 fungal-type domain-containing protein n=1 Tax=Polyplosphaeria fusca TaxID=682080 RepID=A0A9P4RAE1_9PLEO|nr:hypothetical protein EJ04DRAFT_508518 [Polyplosphaeria fusca]